MNFTFKTSSIRAFSDDEIVVKVSNQLSRILGYGVTQKRQVGMMFYEQSYVLGNGWGHVCIGGQRDTVLVSINGSGCMAGKRAWEHRLYKWLKELDRARITRADLARDFFEGEYTVDKALADYEASLFSLGARPPEVEQRGNWIKPNGKGRTLNIGSREAGKYARIYEKGLQLGRGVSELFPNWTRVEGELHNTDREIPLDVLLYPGQYLAGLYPAFAFIHDKQRRIKTKKNAAKIGYDAMVNVCKQQMGKALWVMREIEGSAEAAFNRVVREGVPKRLNDACMDYRNALPPLELEIRSFDLACALAFGGAT